MSYINRKTKIFLEGPPVRVIPVRSEARLKTYLSSTDTRAWSDVVEERRQHILEYAAKNKEGTCFDKDFPLEALLDAMMACKNCKIRKLLKKINYSEKLLRIYSQIDLTADQQRKLKELLSGLQKAYKALGAIDCDQDQLTVMFEAGKDDERPTGNEIGKTGDHDGEEQIGIKAGGVVAGKEMGVDGVDREDRVDGVRSKLEDELDLGDSTEGGPGDLSGSDGPSGIGAPGIGVGKILPVPVSAQSKCQARCAALVRQVQERSSVQAVTSGGVVTLPEKQDSVDEGLIPQGYLPGETLPEIIRCEAACAKFTETDKSLWIMPKESDEHKMPETFSHEMELTVGTEVSIAGTMSRVLSGETVGVGIAPSLKISSSDQNIPKTLSAEILQKRLSERSTTSAGQQVKVDVVDVQLGTEIISIDQSVETTDDEMSVECIECVPQETQTPEIEYVREEETEPSPLDIDIPTDKPEEITVVSDVTNMVQEEQVRSIVEDPVIIDDVTVNDVVDETTIPRVMKLDELEELDDLADVESHVTQKSDVSFTPEPILTPISEMPSQQLGEDYMPRAASLEVHAVIDTVLDKVVQSEFVTSDQTICTETPRTVCKAVCSEKVDLKSTGVSAARHVCPKPEVVQVLTEPIYIQPAPTPVQVIVPPAASATPTATPPIEYEEKFKEGRKDRGSSPCHVTFDKSTEPCQFPERKEVCTCMQNKTEEFIGRRVCTCQRKEKSDECTDDTVVNKICKAVCSTVLPSTSAEQEGTIEVSQRTVCKSVKRSDERRQDTVVSKICKAVCASILPLASERDENITQDAGNKVCDCQLGKHVRQGIYATSIDETLPSSVADKDAEILALRKGMMAKEAYCAEQRKLAAAAIEQLENIKNIVEERDDLRRKLENSQYELDDIKRNIALGKPYVIGEADRGEGKQKKDLHVPLIDKPTEQNSCDEEISALEEEINAMRSGKLTPDVEAQVIRKEVEVLKKYCAKLSSIQEENYQLKNKLAEYDDKFKFLGTDSSQQFGDLKEKLEHLNETEKERDMLKVRVEKLERELYNYKDLREDIEAFKQRSMLLDEVLKDRDRLSKRVEELRGIEREANNLRKKSAKVDELDEQLNRICREKNCIEEELRAMKCRCSAAEIDALNQKAEGDTLRSKLVCVEHELESLKCICKENDRLKTERSHLQKSVDDLMRTQGDYEHMCTQMKRLDVLKSERDMYKSKYESLIGLECECDILRAQVDRAKCIEKERDALESQVEDLEYCIAEQEDEIRRLVAHIDSLAQGRDQQQEKLKGVLTTMRAELERKECIIASSEEKLACVQDQLKNSIEGLSCETTSLRSRNEKLEKEICQLKRCNDILRNQLKEEETIKYNLQKTITECQADLNNTDCISESKARLTMKDSSNETENSEQKRCEDELEKEICRLKGKNNILQAQLTEKDNEISNLKKSIREAVPQGSKRAQSSSEESIGCDCDILKNELEAAKAENRRLQGTLNKMGSMAGDHHVQEIIRQSKCALQVITQELSRQYQEWDCIKKKLAEQGTRPTQEHGMGTEDSNLWDCRKGVGKTDNDNWTQWDCKKGDDWKKWDCKQEAVPKESKPGSEIQCTCDKDCTCKDVENVPDAGKPEINKNVEYYPNIEEWDCMKRKKGKIDGVTQCACESIDGETQCDCQKDTEFTQFHTKRSDADVQCDDGRDKIEQLEKDLTQSNEAILKLKERLCTSDRVCAENAALRRHSSEVQEVAKDQIEELVEHLKKAREKVTNLEGENNKLSNDISDLQNEKEKLLNIVKELKNSCGELTTKLEQETQLYQQSVDKIKELNNKLSKGSNDMEDMLKDCQKQKEELNHLKIELDTEKSNCNNLKSENENLKNQLQDMEKILTTNVVTTSRRSSKLESDMESLKNENEELKTENGKLKELLEKGNQDLLTKIDRITSENNDLRNKLETAAKELQAIKTLQFEQAGIDALKKENENLQKQMEDQKREMVNLLDKLNKPLPTSVCRLNKAQMEKDQKEKDALQSIINDLENQLKMAGQKFKPVCPTVGLKDTINDLTKRLEEEQNRADAAEEALRKLRASDPSLMLNDEIAKLKQKIAELENENNKLSQMAGDSNESARLRQELEAVLNNLRQLDAENANLKQAILSLQNENNALKQSLDALQADSQIKEDYEKMKGAMVESENDRAKLKRDLDQMSNELQKAYDKISQLQDENGNLKQTLAKMDNENSKLKKDLEAVINDMQKNIDKIARLEQDNAKYQQQVTSLEAEIARLKQDLGSTLSEAKKGCSGVSDLQNQLAQLKKMVAELEIENANLKKDLKNALGNAKSGCLGAAQLRDENGKLKLAMSDLQSQLENLKQELANSAHIQNELSDLRDKLARLEAENAQLKKDLSAAIEEVKKGALLQDEAARLRQQLAELENENSKIKKDLEKAIQEAAGVDQQRDEANRLRDLLAKLEAENAKLKGDLNSALDDLKKANAMVAQLQENDSKMKQRLEMLEAENSKMKTDLQQALDDAKKAAAALAQLRDDESKLKQRIAQLETENSKIKQDLDASLASAAELQKLRDENNKLKQNILQMQDENSKLRKDLDDSKASDKEAKLKQQVSQLENENSKLKQELENLRNEHKNCAKIISQLKDEIEALKSKLARLEKENADLRRDYEGAMGDAKRSAAELARLKDSEAKLKEQLLKLQGDNDKLSKEITALNAEIKNSAGSLGQLKDNEAKLKQRIAQLESENAKLKSDLDAALQEAKKYAQLKDEDAKSKQKISQLEAELARLKRELDSALGGAKKGAGDEDLKQRLALLEAEIKKLKSDLEKAENEAKKSNADLSKLRDDDNKLKQRLAQLENENAKLKKELEKALSEAQSGSSGVSQLKDENNKLKQRISQLESEIAKLKKDLDAALDDAKRNASGLSKMQEEDARLKQLIAQLEKDNARLKSELEAALKEAKSGSSTANQLKDENAKQKQRIAQLESEIANLKKLQEENAKLKQRVSELEQQLSQMQNNMAKMKGDLEAALVQAEKGKLVDDYEAKLKQLQAELERQKKECNDMIASLKEQFDRDRKKLLKDNEDSIARLQKAYEAQIRELNEKHDNALKSAQDALRKAQADLESVKAERDKLKGVLEDQRKKSIEIKDKVEKVESVVSKERKKSKDLEEEVRSLKKELSVVKELPVVQEPPVPKKLSVVQEPPVPKKLSVVQEVKEKSLSNLTKETFETATIIGVFPEIIAITAPLSDKELQFFGTQTCPCDTSFEAVVNKFAMNGIESLSIEELQLLHAKICDATANVLEKIGQSSGVLKPNEGNKLSLMKRVAELEGDLMKKQKHAQQKVTAMQYAVKLEKERLSDLRKNLEEEKQKNNMLQNQIGSQSKIASNIQEERDLIRRQKSYHEVKMEHYIVKIEEERAKQRSLEDELQKEKSNVIHLKKLLEIERDRAKLGRRRDSEALETMRIKLEKTLNSEMMLKMKLQDKSKQRSSSPGCTPVRDTASPLTYGSKSYYPDTSASGTKQRICCTKPHTGIKKSSSTSSNGLDFSDK